MGGQPVMVIANQPTVLAGSIDAAAAAKAARWITVADSYHVPLLFLTDNPGMLPGTRSEKEGVLRAGGRMFAAESLATTPKVNLTLRKAYGFGSMATAMSLATRADQQAADGLRQGELDASYNAAERLGFDGMIDPTEARNAVLSTPTRTRSRRQVPAVPVSRTAITP